MRRLIAATTVLLSALLLFSGLNYYALWDDEAVTALAGEGVWRTGDTSVVLDHNVVAYRAGLLLRGTHERSTPPLAAYLVAPFVGRSGAQAWVVRFPFAVLGLASVGLILFWLYRIDAHWFTWLLVGLALVANVSLWLYCRQCRYYSPAIFSSIAIAYLYLNWNGSRRQLGLLAAASIILLASNYLNYVALQLCLLADYLIVGRKRRSLGIKDWLIVLVPQVVVGLVIVLIWNTLGTGSKEYIQGNTILQRLQLVWMNLRDINRCEYGAGLLLLAAPVLFFVNRKPWLIRAPLVLFGYVTIVSLLSPQLVRLSPTDADVRYLAAVIPLCIAISVLVLIEAARASKWLAIGIAALAFASNLLNGSWVVNDPEMPMRSTIASFVGELWDPPTEPYSPVIAWINQNVKGHESIWVVPDFMTYPLMYHAPKPTYAWQFGTPLPEAFKALPPVHIQGGSELPDYLIAFGPVAQQAYDFLQERRAPYQVVDRLDVNPQDRYRPEILWHRFKTVSANASAGDAIYIFKHGSSASPSR